MFENRCETMPELLLGDGVKKVLVNPHGNCKHLSEDAVHFLDYIRTGTAEDDFTRTIDNAVRKARNHQEWKVEYMNWCAYEMDHRIEKRHAREEERKEGQKRGQKTILLMNQRLLKEKRYDDLERASKDVPSGNA